jgi:hypothetical protein
MIEFHRHALESGFLPCQRTKNANLSKILLRLAFSLTHLGHICPFV